MADQNQTGQWWCPANTSRWLNATWPKLFCGYILAVVCGYVYCTFEKPGNLAEVAFDGSSNRL